MIQCLGKDPGSPNGGSPGHWCDSGDLLGQSFTIPGRGQVSACETVVRVLQVHPEVSGGTRRGD